uniref:ATP-dependent DNA helicase n=1 Tax=Aegilops tauschii subsp. strangulata TaxID=200361 RepID=A0A453JKG8_AEGTS
IRSFGKQDGLDRSHLELYFYDDDPSLEHRYRSCRKEQCQKDKEVITQLVNILHGNPYSEHLRSMGHVDDVDDYHITLNLDQRMDQRIYNTPTTSEVAAVWVEGSERRRQFENSVILQGKNRDIYGIKSYHGCYDALSYPLFFPRGELGWHTDIPKEGVPYETMMAARAARLARGHNNRSSTSGGRLCVSVRDYYCYKFQMRPGIFNPILFGKRLFQQFAVDTYIKIENSRLDYIWGHQDKIRADLYQGLVDSLHAGEGRADSVEKRTVLATSFIGGPRDMRRRYMDAMALVRRYGKPDIFLTMTCNPNWDEIRQELYPGQTPQDRPDLVVRVFRAKLEELKNKLLKKDILGKVRAYVYVVEFQKRGLPHAHFLLIMEGRYKLTCPEQYDRLISAELPNKKKYPELYKLVVKHMMHGPCGALNPECPCTKGRPSCKNHYPRPFNAATLQGKDSYPLYRRREDGCKAMVRKEWLDNRWVVPYNPHLLRYFNCHINVEACGSIKAVKYLFKYIYKGHDRASIAVSEADKNGDIDEIKQYRDARWVTPPEALWRIYGFELSKNSPPVKQLQLHLPNMHMVSFQAAQNIERVVNREGVEKSMLTEYFEANRLHEDARSILYRDFPEWYTWQTSRNNKYWRKRVRDTGGQIGRIVSAHPAEGERYYLRVLLNHVTHATSYEDLRTVNGEILPTFHEAAERRGLIEGDNTLDESLTESTLYEMPSSLRRLFATILVFCEPSDVRGLWEKHLDAMSEDYRRSNPSKVAVEQLVLIDIRNMLQSMGKEIESFPLPDIQEEYDTSIGVTREIFEESTIELNVEDTYLSDSLNSDQRAAYDEIMSAIDRDEGGVFFVDGPGGTGKTFLYRALLAVVRGQKKIAIATATSGVAASIMPGGRTTHSRFKIPLGIDDGGFCSFTKQSGTAKLLQSASLIIWDEASMTKRQAVEALDNSMRDVMSRPDLPFGGKTVVFGGDFRQVLPVVRKGSRD